MCPLIRFGVGTAVLATASALLVIAARAEEEYRVGGAPRDEDFERLHPALG